MNGEEQILKEIKEVKDTVNGNALTSARIEGKLEVHAIQIERNQKDIAKNDDARVDGDKAVDARVEKVEGRLNGLAVKVAAAAATVGAAAGAAGSAITNFVKGGGG